MNRLWVFILVVLGACYDDHGRRDAGRDAFVPADAAPSADAWGDANSDAGPGPCFVEGRAIAGLPESRGDRVGCVCPVGTIGGIAFRAPAPLVSTEGPFTLCTAPRVNTNTSGTSAFTVGLCPDGQVVQWTERDQSLAAGVEFDAELNSGFGCMDAPSCLFAETQLPEALRGRCMYADFSIARTGIIPSTGRGSERGLCSVNWPCLGMTTCIGLSETHTTGACGPPTLPCLGDGNCGIARTHVCMFATVMPAEFRDNEQVQWAGRCVPRESCNALRSQTGDTWTCGPNVPR